MPIETIQLPNELVLLISAVVIFLVTEGLKVIGTWFKKDLSGWGTVIGAIFATSIIAFINGWLGIVPSQYAEPVKMALSLLVMIISGMGLHRNLKLMRPRP